MSEEWFDDLPVVGVLDEDDRSEIALSMGERLEDKVVVDDLNVTGRKSLISSIKAAWGRKTAYEHTSHIFGHIRPTADSNTEIPLTSAISLQADEALRGARIKVTLDQVRIAKYPGGGLHEILFDFYGQNQVEGDQVEHMHFNSKYSGMEGDEIGVLSQPIFVGMNVGAEGIMFKCRTVNVKNKSDESILKMLEEDVFRSGLELAKQINPAIGIESRTAYNLTRLFASRNKNISVQDFCLGLDFSNITTRARLAEGSYVAIQVPGEEAAEWNWDNWTLNPSTGRLCHKREAGQMIPYNYVILGVSVMGV